MRQRRPASRCPVRDARPHPLHVLPSQEAGDDGVATDQMIYTVGEIERIVRLAANIARGRSKVVTRYAGYGAVVF